MPPPLAAAFAASGATAAANAAGLASGGFAAHPATTPLAPIPWQQRDLGCAPELVRLAVLPTTAGPPARALAAARRVAAAACVAHPDVFYTPPSRLHVTVFANSKPGHRVPAGPDELAEEQAWWRAAWGARAPVRLVADSLAMTPDGTIVLLLRERDGGGALARLRAAAAERFPGAPGAPAIVHMTLARCRFGARGLPAGGAVAAAVAAACAEEGAALRGAPLPPQERLRLVREEANPNTGSYVDVHADGTLRAGRNEPLPRG